jgi:tRNA threonylcarbamoyladenosine biosynthesis protein TsaE
VLARTTSVADTRALAAALAALVRPGDVLLLAGEMGAGKTAFTQGLGAALGVTERITSPTFTIAQTYEGGRLRLHHLDVYRLEHLHEALDVGLAEMIDDAAVVVIEWGDAIVPVLPADFLEIRIAFAPLDEDEASGDVRTWQLRPVGARWKARADGLRATLGPWEQTT